MDKICCILLNYNLPYMTNKLGCELIPHLDHYTDLIVLDASDNKDKRSAIATKYIDDNYYGENFRKELELQKDKNDWFVMMSNDIYNLPKKNWLRDLVELANTTNSVIVSPTINKEGTSHKHMYKDINNKQGYRYVNWVDFQTPVIHKSILKEVLKLWTPELKYGWGIDSLFAIESRKRNKNIIVSDEITISHYDKKTFKEKADKLNLQQYRSMAMQNETKFMERMYGHKFWIEWKSRLRNIHNVKGK